jgi:hypothetical protein
MSYTSMSALSPWKFMYLIVTRKYCYLKYHVFAEIMPSMVVAQINFTKTCQMI